MDKDALNRLNGELYDAFSKDTGPVTEWLKWIVDAYGVACPPRVLDIGCGTGRVLREFDRLGWETVGMEPDADFLAEASKVDAESEPVEVRPGGFNDLAEREAYDLIVSIDGPFSYLLTVDERVEALRRAFEALRPGGVLFLEIANFLWMLKNYQEFRETTSNIGDRAVRRTTHYRPDFDQHIWTQIDEYRYDDPEIGPVNISKTHRCAIITQPELRYFLKQQGFREIRSFPDYRAREEGPLTGHDFLIAAQKP
ncbi:MAG: methyltransferase domain-containing protein [FCB group bacterium]|jgi:SAM-dependent methyltransferase|nr:methyltransferase domain-containing protein [FCB group bacterium]